MELVKAIDKKKRLSEFIRFKIFYHSRYFEVEEGSKVDEHAVARLEVLYQFIKENVVEKYDDEQTFKVTTISFDNIFRTQQRNFISVPRLLERNKIVVQDEYSAYPITRGFVKGLEIYTILHHKLGLLNPKSLKTLHLSEMPGGFYFALMYFCQMNAIGLVPKVQSLKYDPVKFPDAFKDRFGLKNRGVLDYGLEYGDLSAAEEVAYFKANYSRLDLVTCDFGYNKWVAKGDIPGLYVKLYNNVIDIATSVLTKRGVFVIKLYLFIPATLKILYNLYLRFGKIRFFKPILSRPHSFEIYILCDQPLKQPKKAMGFLDFLTQCYPYINNVAMKIFSIYKLFEYLRGYKPDDKDEAAIRRFKRVLSRLVLQLFEQKLE